MLKYSRLAASSETVLGHSEPPTRQIMISAVAPCALRHGDHSILYTSLKLLGLRQGQGCA